MEKGSVNLNKNGINPLLGNIKPSFLHIHSPKRNNSNVIETTVTFCLATTTPISIEFSEKSFSKYKGIFSPSILHDELLCIAGQIKAVHEDDIQFIFCNFEHKEFLKSSSDGHISLNETNIKVITSETPYKQFHYKKPLDGGNRNFGDKLYNRIYLKLRFTQISLKRLMFMTAKTFLNITKYIFTSRLR